MYVVKYGVVLFLIVVFLMACERQSESLEQSQSTSSVIDVWVHSGQQAERAVIEDQVERFNQVNEDVQIKLTVLPEGSYNSQVQAAALAGELPDLLEFDGPFLYNYIWQGQLSPIDDLLPAAIKADLLPSIIEQGTFKGKLYSLGTFDSGLALYASRKKLQKAGVRIPDKIDQAWSISEFDEVLNALAKNDSDGAVLDLKSNYTGEWLTYAFSPIIFSAGGDLIDRSTFQRSEGLLNGKEAVEAMAHLQRWFKNNTVDPNLDDASFVAGRVALSWAGHWEYNRYKEVLGDDLIVIPLPDFSQGSKTGQGSWNWGITKKSKHKKIAMRFLLFILQPDEVLRMANANGAVPGTRSAIARSPLYSEQGPLHLLVTQLEQSAVARPQTPAYPLITSVFQQAFAEIRNGADVADALSKAAQAIDQDIRDNQGYAMK